MSLVSARSATADGQPTASDATGCATATSPADSHSATASTAEDEELLRNRMLYGGSFEATTTTTNVEVSLRRVACGVPLSLALIRTDSTGCRS